MIMNSLDQIETHMGIKIGYSYEYGLIRSKDSEFILFEEGSGYHLIASADYKKEDLVFVEAGPIESPRYEEKCKKFLANFYRELEFGQNDMVGAPQKS